MVDKSPDRIDISVPHQPNMDQIKKTLNRRKMEDSHDTGLLLLYPLELVSVLEYLLVCWSVSVLEYWLVCL